MRHFTLNYIYRLMDGTKLAPDRRPAPMPGKNWPTRVAWSITVAQKKLVGKGENQHWALRNPRTLTYIGKPSRYRAMQAWNYLNSPMHSGNSLSLVDYWQAEFDKNGLVAYKRPGALSASGAFFAYHPHSAQVEIVDAFTKPLHIKYVGGMRLYSQKKKLAQEAIDAYYDWYHQQFKRKLRRPKSVAHATIAGEEVDVTTVEGKPEQPSAG